MATEKINNMTEKTFKIKVMKHLKEFKNVWFFKTQEIGRRGIPDILICSKGKMIAIELKTDRGIADPLQLATIDKIREAGGIAFVSCPSGWEQDLYILKTGGYLG